MQNKLSLIIPVFEKYYWSEQTVLYKLIFARRTLPHAITLRKDIMLYNECIDLVHNVVLCKQTDIHYNIRRNILSFTVESYHDIQYIDKWISIIDQYKHNMNWEQMRTLEDVYKRVDEWKSIMMRRVVIESIINYYLPYLMIKTPYDRDSTVKARCTCELRNGEIIVNIPGTFGGIHEPLKQSHIDLAYKQNHKTI